jgi:hypothetical protein
MIMKNTVTVLFTILALFCFSGYAAAESLAYQVTFETLDCNGDSGFATVGVDQIYKIQPAGCAGADGTSLKQLLVHDGSGSYNVYTISQEESENINREIKAYMAARRGILERSEAIIVKP